MQDDPSNKSSKAKGGRPPMRSEEKQQYRVQLYLSEAQFRQLEADFAQSGSKSMSAYLSRRLFSAKQQGLVNPMQLLEKIDHIGVALNQIGKHISQVALYVNTRAVEEQPVETEVVKKFNAQMEAYLKVRQRLVNAYRAMIRYIK